MKFLADIEVEEGLKDSDGDLGSNGQVLSSTGSGTDWIDAAGTIGGSIADNQIEQSLAWDKVGKASYLGDINNIDKNLLVSSFNQLLKKKRFP